MNESMTIKQIKEKFNQQWVLIGDPVCAKDLKIKKGNVLAHSKKRDQLYKIAVKMKPKNFAVLYVGERPKDFLYLL
jgi:hypothetical protein